jgi:hypothetical protein
MVVPTAVQCTLVLFIYLVRLSVFYVFLQDSASFSSAIIGSLGMTFYCFLFYIHPVPCSELLRFCFYWRLSNEKAIYKYTNIQIYHLYTLVYIHRVYICKQVDKQTSWIAGKPEPWNHCLLFPNGTFVYCGLLVHSDRFRGILAI